MKTFFKIFLNPIEGRESFLNKKAKEGYELVSSGSILHKFKKTKQSKKYMVQYIGYMSNKQRKEYKDFIENMNMKVLYSPLNMGKKAYGNVKYRPFNPVKSSVSTTHGMINREIMIVENNSGRKIEIYSDYNSKIRDLNRRKKPYSYLLLMSALIIFTGLLEKAGVNVKLFNQTLFSFRPLENIISGWILLGVLLLLFSSINIMRLNNIIKKTDSNTI